MLMDPFQQHRIEAILKHALEKDNLVFRSKWTMFEYLEQRDTDQGLLYQNALEIERTWKRLSLSAPPMLPSRPPHPSPRIYDADREQRNAFGITKVGRVPIFDRNVQLTTISIFLPDNAQYSHANTKPCRGDDSYISIKTVKTNQLVRDKDGTVVVKWKHQKYQPTVDQTARHTRCVVLEHEDAEAMQVDILFGSKYESGIIGSPASSLSSDGSTHPQITHSPPIIHTAGNPAHELATSWNHPPVFAQNAPATWHPNTLPYPYLPMGFPPHTSHVYHQRYPSYTANYATPPPGVGLPMNMRRDIATAPDFNAFGHPYTAWSSGC
ncbi:hypothetical protein GGR54DRAFT_142691 [Hypoxylon sp. NC1633]|nr:hypothetical protein GGR54DRAFT_142691 [Hypoxylon sp. NC1633]